MAYLNREAEPALLGAELEQAAKQSALGLLEERGCQAALHAINLCSLQKCYRHL